MVFLIKCHQAEAFLRFLLGLTCVNYVLITILIIQVIRIFPHLHTVQVFDAASLQSLTLCLISIEIAQLRLQSTKLLLEAQFCLKLGKLAPSFLTKALA